MVKFNSEIDCTGCGACLNICPENAIEMLEDKYGYNYPIINKDRCINCFLCNKVCPVSNKYVNSNFENPIVNLAWNKNEEVRLKSTSGGVFSAIADLFLLNGDYVVGAEYTDDFSIKHTIICEKNHLSKLRQTKYAQSNMDDIYIRVQNLLKAGKKVLFCGTACQNAAMRNFIDKYQDNVLFVEIVCRGVVSQKIYREYLKSVEKHSKGKIESIEFRNKDNGWLNSSTKISLNNNKVYYKTRSEDEYMVGYLKHNLFIRPSCSDCKFKSFPRIADITLGDFWGLDKKFIEEQNDKGFSVVMINSDKGRKVFDQLKDIHSENTSLDIIIKNNPCIIESVQAGNYSEYFYKKFLKTDFIELIHKIEYKWLKDNNKLTFRDKLFFLKRKIIKR